MWVRGLKPLRLQRYEKILKSHPMWVRGLKRKGSKILLEEDESHPMWVRGLKHVAIPLILGMQKVAPHVGAWIET